jgi:hypothetical protein
MKNVSIGNQYERLDNSQNDSNLNIDSESNN